jgi:hypothetical protein
MTAALVSRNILGGGPAGDPRRFNQGPAYRESSPPAGGGATPED